jgi:uncharacterized membrane protein
MNSVPIVVGLSVMSAGLVIFFISLPLMYRKIPMNAFYGIRIPAAFKSEQSWYDINAYGGRKLAAWSWLITIAGLGGFFVPFKYLAVYGAVTVVVTLFAIAMPMILTFKWIRRSAA